MHKNVYLGQPLSLREREALMLICMGHSYKSASREMNISHWTIQEHIKACYGKLDVHNAREAMVKLQQLEGV